MTTSPSPDHAISIFRRKAEYDPHAALVAVVTDKLKDHPTPANEITRWDYLASIIRDEADAVLCRELVTWLDSNPDTPEGTVLTAWAANLNDEALHWAAGTPIRDDNRPRATAAARLRREYALRSFLGEA